MDLCVVGLLLFPTLPVVAALLTEELVDVEAKLRLLPPLTLLILDADLDEDSMLRLELDPPLQHEEETPLLRRALAVDEWVMRLILFKAFQCVSRKVASNVATSLCNTWLHHRSLCRFRSWRWAI